MVVRIDSEYRTVVCDCVVLQGRGVSVTVLKGQWYIHVYLYCFTGQGCIGLDTGTRYQYRTEYLL